MSDTTRDKVPLVGTLSALPGHISECVIAYGDARAQAALVQAAPAVEPKADPLSVMRWLDEHCKKVAWSIESATFEINDEQAFALVTSFLSPPTDAAPQPAQEGEPS